MYDLIPIPKPCHTAKLNKIVDTTEKKENSMMESIL